MPHEKDAPEGFELREASVEDAAAVAELINEVTLAEIGRPWASVERTRAELAASGFEHLPAGALLIGDDGTLAACLQMWTAAPFTTFMALVFVRPHLWGRGLSAWLLHLGEQRACAAIGHLPPGNPRVLRAARFADNEPARRLFASRGFAYVRTFWLMETELTATPSSPRPPRGVSIRPYDPGWDDARLHAALAESFRNHWGDSFPEFEEWHRLEIGEAGSSFDPGLWFVATDGEEIIGAVCCRGSSPRAIDTARVSNLAVRPSWRRRGVARALLLTAFTEFVRRDIPRAELTVDAENPTGATRLYEQAGMQPALSWEVWEKQLRPAS